MKLTTVILIISLVILSVLCTVLAYLRIDRSITLAYVIC
ncbi:Imm58 family immunity protein [Hafnia alvei]